MCQGPRDVECVWARPPEGGPCVCVSRGRPLGRRCPSGAASGGGAYVTSGALLLCSFRWFRLFWLWDKREDGREGRCRAAMRVFVCVWAGGGTAYD